MSIAGAAATAQTELPVLDTPLSRRARKLITQFRDMAAGGHVPRLYIIRQREPAESTDARRARVLRLGARV